MRLGASLALSALLAPLALLALLAGAPPASAACRGQDLLAGPAATDPGGAARLEAAGRAVPFGRGRLFRVGREGVAPSHVFATIHVADPRVLELPPALRRAIERADGVALELAEAERLADPSALATLSWRALAAFLARAEERAERLFEPDEIGRLEAALVARGLPASAARTLKPALLAVIVSQPGCARETGGRPVLDALLAGLARREGVPVVGLETVAEQVAALAGLAPEVQQAVVRASLRLLPQAEDLYETAIARYLKGEIGTLLALMRHPEPVGGVLLATPAAFAERLVDERNRRMLERTLPLLARGNAVVAVGAAHLPGEGGLLRLLEEAGYRVEPVE